MGGQVLIAESTFVMVRSNIETRGTRTINLKGVEQGVTIYDVKAVTLPAPMNLPDETPAAKLLEIPLPVSVHVMKNKEVDGGPKSGLLTHFSLTWACVRMSDKIEITQEIRLDLMDPDAKKPVSMYARIASLDREPDGNSYWVRISYISPGTEQFVQRLSKKP